MSLIRETVTFIQKEHFKCSDPKAYKDGWINSKGNLIDGILEDDSYKTETINDSWSSEIEEIHEEPTKTGWIDVYERQRFLGMLSTVLSGKDKLVIEFGASSGYMIEEIRNSYPQHTYVATDLMVDGLRQSYKRNKDIMHIRCDFTNAPFVDGCADFVFSLNVLEHISDDMVTIKECHRILKRGGYCAFIVPRGDKLYDYFDEMLFHKRRYATGELKEKCKQAGFSVVDNFHIAWLCYPAFWLKKKLNRLVGRKLTQEEKMNRVQADIKGAIESPLAMKAMQFEHSLSKMIKPTFGIREIILLKKE